MVAVCRDLLDRATAGRLAALAFIVDDAEQGRLIGRVGFGPERAVAAATQMVHRFTRWMNLVHGVPQD
jgi:hypothetical protein